MYMCNKLHQTWSLKTTIFAHETNLVDSGWEGLRGAVHSTHMEGIGSRWGESTSNGFTQCLDSSFSRLLSSLQWHLHGAWSSRRVVVFELGRPHSHGIWLPRSRKLKPQVRCFRKPHITSSMGWEQSQLRPGVETQAPSSERNVSHAVEHVWDGELFIIDIFWDSHSLWQMFSFSHSGKMPSVKGMAINSWIKKQAQSQDEHNDLGQMKWLSGWHSTKRKQDLMATLGEIGWELWRPSHLPQGV